MNEQPLSRPGSQVHTASLTTATAGMVLWSVERYAFHGGEIPGPVYLFLQIAVPALCGRLGAELAYRRARRRLDFPPGPQ